MKLVFHAKILARFQFEWFWLCPSAQYMLPNTQFFWFLEGHRHLIQQPYLKIFCKQSYFMKTKVPVTYWVQFVIPSGYLWLLYECKICRTISTNNMILLIFEFFFQNVSFFVYVSSFGFATFQKFISFDYAWQEC